MCDVHFQSICFSYYNQERTATDAHMHTLTETYAYGHVDVHANTHTNIHANANTFNNNVYTIFVDILCR